MFVVRLNKGTGKQIRNIKVICEDFARHRVLDALGGESVARQHIHLGIQRRDDIIESVPANPKASRLRAEAFVYCHCRT